MPPGSGASDLQSAVSRPSQRTDLDGFDHHMAPGLAGVLLDGHSDLEVWGGGVDRGGRNRDGEFGDVVSTTTFMTVTCDADLPA